MANADFAIGAAGVTAWERICLGLPSLVITAADNQRPVTACMRDLGLVEYIGNYDDVDVESIARSLVSVMEFPSLEEWSRRCLATCSGRGVVRVAEQLESMSAALE